MFYWGGDHDFIIRRIKNSKKLYLTFDDGPDPDHTPAVLDLLSQYHFHATFFVIGTSAHKHSSIIERMLNDGHSVFSHSIDHNYENYFKSKKRLKDWLQASLDDLSQTTGLQTSYFRPPAGVLTPPLVQAAQEMNIKLVLWTHRFYDAVWPFYQWHCQLSLSKLQEGDIILLHDKQKPTNKKLFLSTLEFLLASLTQSKLSLESLYEKEFEID